MYICIYIHIHIHIHAHTDTHIHARQGLAYRHTAHTHPCNAEDTHTHTDFVVFEWRNAFLYLDGPHVSSLDVQPVCCVLSETLLPQSSPTMVVFVCVIKEGRASGYQ